MGGVDSAFVRERLVTTTTFITYCNGLFIGVGAFGAIFTSIDGYTWLHRDSGNRAYIFSITYIAANSLLVSLPNESLIGPAKISIYNMGGKKIDSQITTSSRSQAYIKTKSFPVGIYLLRVETNNTSMVTKLHATS